MFDIEFKLSSSESLEVLNLYSCYNKLFLSVILNNCQTGRKSINNCNKKLEIINTWNKKFEGLIRIVH